MNQVKMIPWSFPWRKVIGFCLGSIGVAALGYTVPLPSISLECGVNHPIFFKYALDLEIKEQTSLSPLTTMVVDRWGWVAPYTEEVEEVLEENSHFPSIDEGESESLILPAIPQPVVKSEEKGSASLQGDWVTRTMVPGATHVQVGDIYVANSGKVSITDSVIPSSSPISLEVEETQPQILIYHSHGTESYFPTVGYEYEESDPYRTLQQGRNIISVGEAMVAVFQGAGYEVIHDKTYHDYPDYNQSYSNSGVMLQKYLEEYPSIQLIFDVHRDALEDSTGKPYQLVSQQEEGEIAQVMLVVGSNGDGYSHDNWRENFNLALKIQENLLSYGDFARPVTLRSSRFNQHLSTGALLVEVGGHGNTLQQAIDAGTLFAQAVVEVLGTG